MSARGCLAFSAAARMAAISSRLNTLGIALGLRTSGTWRRLVGRSSPTSYMKSTAAR
jgi:hypothetical protein